MQSFFFRSTPVEYQHLLENSTAVLILTVLEGHFFEEGDVKCIIISAMGSLNIYPFNCITKCVLF